MESLPPEILAHIFKFLSYKHKLQLRIVSQKIYKSINYLMKKELCYYIDDKRPCNAKSVEECIEYLSQYNFAIHQLCFHGFELYKSEAFVKLNKLDKILKDVFILKLSNCFLSGQILCIFLNKIKCLKTLHFDSVTFYLSFESQLIQLKDNTFNHLTRLNISFCSSMVDNLFVKLCTGMKQLQILEITKTKMKFYPNYIRRYYYMRPDDCEYSWYHPTKYGFTFNIVRAMLTLLKCPLNEIRLGPEISIDNIDHLIEIESLQNIHLMFESEEQSYEFKNKIKDLRNRNSLKKNFYFHRISSTS